MSVDNKDDLLARNGIEANQYYYDETPVSNPVGFYYVESPLQDIVQEPFDSNQVLQTYDESSVSRPVAYFYEETSVEDSQEKAAELNQEFHEEKNLKDQNKMTKYNKKWLLILIMSFIILAISAIVLGLIPVYLNGNF